MPIFQQMIEQQGFFVFVTLADSTRATGEDRRSRATAHCKSASNAPQYISTYAPPSPPRGVRSPHTVRPLQTKYPGRFSISPIMSCAVRISVPRREAPGPGHNAACRVARRAGSRKQIWRRIQVLLNTNTSASIALDASSSSRRNHDGEIHRST